jgi:hypothetical protein
MGEAGAAALGVGEVRAVARFVVCVRQHRRLLHIGEARMSRGGPNAVGAVVAPGERGIAVVGQRLLAHVVVGEHLLVGPAAVGAQ